MADNRKKGILRETSGIRRPGESRNAVKSTQVRSNGQSDVIKKRNEKARGTVVTESSSKNSGKNGSSYAKKIGAGKKINKKTSTPFVIGLILVWIAVVFVSAFFAYTYLVDKYENPITEDNIFIDPDTSVEFSVEKGATTREIAENLYEMGLIANKSIYRFLSKFNGYDGNYNAGTHILCADMTYEEIMVILTGNPEVVKVLIPEGYTTSQIAARLEQNNVCKATDFYKAVETVDVSSYPFIQTDTFVKDRDNRLDGYLFPDTYQFEANSDPETVIYKMLNRFNEVFKPDYYERTNDIGLTIDEVVTLASLVEKEAKLDDERAKIAGVFYNRLRSDDPDVICLQSSATIMYVYKKLYNFTPSEVTEEEMKVSDPYNTYIREGLPPGPICNPGLASIIAALQPEEHEYYYFSSAGDGTAAHFFSRTFEEQKEYHENR